MVDERTLRERSAALEAELNERQRRLFAASEAKAGGWGGLAAASRATGRARSTIGRGLKDLSGETPLEAGRIRRKGGGRKSAASKDPTLLADLNRLVDPTARGDPMSSLRWTCKSLSQLAGELQAQGHRIGRTVIAELLKSQNFSLQSNRKTLEGSDHADRNAQFEFINSRVATALAEKQPVISVDSKKKELVGDFKNAGREWRPQGNPEAVRVHDFLIKELGKAAPYGVYDLADNSGWVCVGMDHDTSAFAVNTIRRWWCEVGVVRYPKARRLVITADGGGSNGSRVRLWKFELQRLADELGIEIEVHHLPPGTSKWNAIEHKLFSFISMNWRATPLVSYQVIVSLIGATTTKTGLAVRCELDENKYPKGLVISDDQMAALNIERAAFHGEWNYTIKPTALNSAAPANTASMIDAVISE
jgi:hypothetical protein